MTWGAAIQSGSALGAAFINRETAKDIRRKEEEKQKKFAQNTIQWKVADAKAAGIHPLYALGAATQGYQPMHVGGGDLAVGRGIEEAGQHIGRAVDQMRDAHTKQMKIAELQIAQEKAKQEVINTAILNAEKSKLETAAMPSFGEDPVDKWYGILGQSGGAAKGTGSQGEQIPGQPGTERVLSEVPWQTSLGIKAGLVPMEQFNWRKDRSIGLDLTEEMTQMMEENLKFKVGYYGHTLADYYAGFMATVRGPDHEKSIKWMNFWRKILPQTPEGYYWEYMAASGRFKLKHESEYKRKSRRFPRSYFKAPHLGDIPF